MSTFSQRLGGRAYTIVRFLVRLLSVALILAMTAFVFLRVYGVPDPLLREAVRRFNAVGIPVDVESVRLTLRGWRVTGFSYYSRHPDDLNPIIHADELLLKHMMLPGKASSGSHAFDVAAQDVVLTPSVEWGIDFPADSMLGRVDSAKVAVVFLPDRIELSDGTLTWMGVDFHVNGAFLRKKPPAPAHPPVLDTDVDEPPRPPSMVSADIIRKVERWLRSLELNGAADVDIDFLIDAGDFSASTLSCSSLINDFVFRNVAFSRAEIAFQYAYPQVELQHASLYKDNRQLRIEGSYALDTKLTQLSVSNTIQSRRLLLLLPQRFLGLLTGIELGFGSLPALDINFGPAVLGEVLNRISGSFKIRDARYHNLEIRSLSGTVKRENNRLEFLELEGEVEGQEHRRDEVGSCMIGGSATGEVFWDAGTHEYGVLVEGSFDPNLLIAPLSFNEPATNVIQRFRFEKQPPRARVELGQNYSKRHTFFINIQGSARDIYVHDVLFSSVNTSVAYKAGILTLERVFAKQGSDYASGSVVLDFANELATFDAESSISPAAMEDVIYPGVNLFGNKIKFAGKTKVTARGCVDWRHMRATDFEAVVEAEQGTVPVGLMDNLTATVTGKETEIRVGEASFSIYGGQGSGALSLQLDPHGEGIPYTLDVALTNVDFRRCIQFFRPDDDLAISGNLSADAHIESDFLQDFFEVTNGQGKADIKDGQLADLPLFRGFSKLMRKILPSFSVFSINSLSGDFEIKDGVVYSENAYFDGNLLSAKGQGSYAVSSGYDAYVQAQVFSDNPVSKVLRVITDPFFRLLLFKLEGPLSDPSWHLDNFSTPSEVNPAAD